MGGIFIALFVTLVVIKYGGDVLSAILEFFGELVEILKPVAGWIIIGIGATTFLCHLYC